jgi:hypothetical protein
LQAHLAALMSYRATADLLGQLFPVDTARHHKTLGRHALKVGETPGDCGAIRLETVASAVVATLDSTFIRSCENGRTPSGGAGGNIETESGPRQVFGAVAKAETDIKVLINRNLDAIDRTKDTSLTAFTDGCPGLRRILADAGVTDLPFLDRFYIGMRLQHQQSVVRRALASDGVGSDHRGSRVPALAAVEWQSHQREDQHRPHPRGHAPFQG